jgi:hypothetical protein
MLGPFRAGMRPEIGSERMASEPMDPVVDVAGNALEVFLYSALEVSVR